jgi:hypothetical protein
MPLVRFLIISMLCSMLCVPLLAQDPYPKGCVDCHVKRAGMPTPISSDIKSWTVNVDPKLVARLQPAAPKGVTLKGKHPNVAAMVKEIPSGCLKCHAQGSKMAPPLSAIAHIVHLTGEKNPFLTTLRGECASCHKLNAATGEMVLASAAEE